MLPTRIALRCLFRTFCVNAAVTARGMQLIGQLYALQPGLRHLYPDQSRRAEAVSRYLVHSNTHPYMLPFYVGTVLGLENLIASGSLSAIGDGFFEGALLPCWTLMTVALLLANLVTPALVLLVLMLLALLAFRCVTFFYALRNGITALAGLKRLNLINWSRRIKIANALLITGIFWQLAPYEARLAPWNYGLISLVVLLGAAWVVGRWRLPRIVLWLATLGILIFMDERLLGV